MGTIYLSKAGSDANAGTSISLPKLTLDSAYTAAVDGDSICFLDPWGLWQEDWSGLGYIQFAKASMTTGIHFWSFFPDRPAAIGGLSGTFSVRIASSGHRFSNVDILSGSTSNTTIFGCNTSSVMDNIRLRNVRIRNVHDIDSSSAYMVQLAGTGVHTNWDLIDCTLDPGPSSVINGVYTGNSDGFKLIRTRVNLPRYGGGYSCRIYSGSLETFIDECELDGNYGILQDTAAASQDIIIVRSKIRGRTYAASFGGTSSGTCRIFARDTKVYGDGLGIAGQSNITFDAEGLDCISDNVAIGMPTDGAYSNTRALLHGCKSSTHGIGGSGHALLFGVGSVNAVVKRHYACSRRSGWGVVMKGTGGLLEDSDVVGGPMSTLYFKGADAWTVNRCSIVQEVGGSAIEVKNGDTTPLSSDLKITNSSFTVTSGELFDFGDGTHEDGTSQVDYNRYRVVASGTWGNILGNAVASLANVRTQWDSYAITTNDELSVVDAREMLISDVVTIGDEVEGRELTLVPAYDAAKTAAQTGDQMDLVNAPNATAVSAIQNGLATSNDIDALNQSASRRILITGVRQYEKPEAGSTVYTIEVRTYSGDGAAVDADSTPTLTGTGATSGSLAAAMGSPTNPDTGVYRWTFTVTSSSAIEPVRFDASATIGGDTFTISLYGQVLDFVAEHWTTTDRSKLEAIYLKLPSKPYLTGSSNATGDIELDDATGALAASHFTAGALDDKGNWSKAGDQMNLTATYDIVVTSATRFGGMIQLDGAVYRFTANALEQAPAGGGGGGGDVNVVSVNGLPVDTSQVNITVVNTTTVQNGTLVLYRQADYSVANGNPILFTDVANIDSAENLYLTIVDNQAETAVFTRKVAASFSEVGETATFAATAAELNVDSGAHYAFVVERLVGAEYNPILWGPCTIKDNNRTFPA